MVVSTALEKAPAVMDWVMDNLTRDERMGSNRYHGGDMQMRPV
jgi:hypothetical protein